MTHRVIKTDAKGKVDSEQVLTLAQTLDVVKSQKEEIESRYTQQQLGTVKSVTKLELKIARLKKRLKTAKCEIKRLTKVIDDMNLEYRINSVRKDMTVEHKLEGIKQQEFQQLKQQEQESWLLNQAAMTRNRKAFEDERRVGTDYSRHAANVTSNLIAKHNAVDKD